MEKVSKGTRPAWATRVAAIVVAAAALLVSPIGFGGTPAFAGSIITQTHVSSSPNPSQVNEGFTITVTVNYNNTDHVDNGNVHLYVDGVANGEAAVDSNGQATFTLALAFPHTYQLKALYGGGKYNDATGFTQSYGFEDHTVVGPMPTWTQIQELNPLYPTETQKITAKARVGAQYPTDGSVPAVGGTVDFSTNGIFLCGGSPIDANGYATCEFGPLSGGSWVITASYSGTSAFGSSTGSANLYVTPRTPTTTTLSATPNPAAPNEEVTITASVSVTATGAAVTEGAVGFANTGTVSCDNVPVDSNGVATCTTTYASAGKQTIYAVYYGTDTYASVNALPYELSITGPPKTKTTTGVSSSLNPSPFSHDLTFRTVVTIDEFGHVPSGGEVGLYVDGSLWQTATIDSFGVASFTRSDLAVGDHTVMATYNGTSTYAKSTSGTFTETVVKDPTTVAVTSSQNPAEVGSTITVTATVTGSVVNEGSVVFSVDGVDLPAVPVDGNGQASRTDVATKPGTYSVVAKYSGSGNFEPSTSQPMEQVVTNVATATAVTSDHNPSLIGDQVTVTATVTSHGSPVPVGSVTFKDGSNVIGTATLDANGQATTSTSVLTFGTHTISAEYSGAAYLDPSTGSVDQVVSRFGTSTAITSSKNPASANEEITFTATVTAGTAGIAAANAAPAAPVTVTNGTVTFSDNGNPICTDVALSSSGAATCTTGQLSAGQHTITASYNASDSYDSSSADLLQEVAAVLGSTGSNTNSTGAAQPTGGAGSRGLARTGADLFALMVVGLLLVGLGVGARRARRRLG